MKRAWIAALVAIACSAHPSAPEGPRAQAHLELHVDARDGHAVKVTGHFRDARSASIALPSETIRGITSFELRRGDRWIALDPHKLTGPECETDCWLRYTIDLARVTRSFDGVVPIGQDAWVAPSSTWLARPDPLPPGAFDITIDGAAEPGDSFSSVRFATGLRRADTATPTRYLLPTEDFDEGSFAAFGKLRHRRIEAAGATIEIVIVGETRLALDDAAVTKWIGEDASCVAQLYGHFPVSRATLFVVPLEGSTKVVFGKVLSLGGASIIALTGTEFTADKAHNDWVVVHEMTHLGFPTMGVRWLTEGLATYYEPILRTRAGWIDRQALWSWFVEQMPRGVPAEGAELALDKRDTIDDVYWGGALFVLLADVGIRSATGGKKSFDDVMRAVLARGGNATVAWTLPEVLAVARETTGTNVVDELVERFGVRGERVDLDSLFSSLGVRPPKKDVAGKSTMFDESAGKAAIRRAIESGH